MRLKTRLAYAPTLVIIYHGMALCVCWGGGGGTGCKPCVCLVPDAGRSTLSIFSLLSSLTTWSYGSDFSMQCMSFLLSKFIPVLLST